MRRSPARADRATRSVSAAAWVVFLAGLLTAGVLALTRSGAHRPSLVRLHPAGPAPPTTPLGTVPGPGQTRVSGTVTLLMATDAVGAPLPLPVTVSVPNRGQGDMTIDHVSEGGRTVTVVWNAGQPLPLSGSGALDLGPAQVEADASGITWHLDLAPRALAAGHYVAGAPVAVGSAGLAQPMDSVGFDAGPGAGFITNGDARVHLGPRPLDLTGPGRVRLSGHLTLETATGTRSVATLTFGPGPFELHLRPLAGGGAGYAVDALLQGPVAAA